MVDGSDGVLAIDITGSICNESGVCCEAVDDERQGGETTVAEEEFGRSVKGEKRGKEQGVTILYFIMSGGGRMCLLSLYICWYSG